MKFLFSHSITTTFTFKRTRAIKRSHFGRSLCYARLFQSLEKSSVPQTTRHQKKEQPRKMAALFLLSSFLVFTRSLPAFGVASASATPHNSDKLHCAVFASTATPLFGGCSLNQPSRLAPLKLCPKSRNPAEKRRVTLIFSVPFHAHSPYTAP